MPSEKKEITGKTTFLELVQNHPKAVPVIMEYGLHCVGCHAAAFETIEQGAKGHGLDDKQLEEMLEKINTAIKEEKIQAEKNA